MRRHGHGFLTAGDNDLCVAEGDLLHAERNGTQARAAKLIDAPCRGFLRNAGLHCSLTSWVLAFTGLQDLAKNDLVHLLRGNARTLQRALDGGRPELVSRNCAESTIEGTDSGARCAGDDDG